MKRFFFIAYLLVYAGASPSFAADRCYGPEEVEAEKLLRLHSEMMVTTVTCRYGGQGEDLSRLYGGFTKKNITVLHEAEETMMGYYQKTSGGKGIDELDQLRTRLANEFGQEIARVSAPAYCAQRRDRVVTLATAPSDLIRIEAERIVGQPYARVCKGEKEKKIAARKARKGS